MKESKLRAELRNAYAFERDLPYTKDQIWNEGKVEDRDVTANAEIYRVFGHDVATYPNQDNPQHYPTVQFAGDVANNKNHVLQDHQTSRTAINHALRNEVENAKGLFARDGEYTRDALWDKVPVEGEGVQRTKRGLRQDLDQFQSRESHTVNSKEFEHQSGYLKSEIFGGLPEPVKPQPEPAPTPEAPVAPKPAEKPCTDCPEGTLGHALAHAERAESAVEKAIAPVATASENAATTTNAVTAKPATAENA